MKKYIPIDMPKDFGFALDGFEQATQNQMKQFIEKAHKEGKWRATEHILFDPNSTEFWAYYTQKALNPIKAPKKGSQLEEKFAPYRKTQFNLEPKGFKEEKSYRMSAVGDLMRGKHADKSKDRIYEAVEDLIFSADCIYGNLESTIALGEPMGITDGFKTGGTPSIGLTRDEYKGLTRHKGRKFDVLQLANNHVMDNGQEGIELNMSVLNQDEISFTGVYENESDSQEVMYTTHNGIKIGWVAHTFSVNFKPIPKDEPWLVDITSFCVEENPDMARIEQQIKNARAEGCDLVIVTPHWGAEWEFFPWPEQMDWARRFAELGADAVIGTHPHVIQPVEIYTPKSDPDKSVPILYSLGNFIPMAGPSYTVLSLVANLKISKGQLNGADRTMVTGLEITPVAFMGEEDDDQIYASIVPLAELNNSNLDPDTQDFVNRINSYADFVIGEDWRK
ncbi:CapA family protein [Sediminitomix flava]|uniref:Poly-gamma-glutamate synthesis protein (Capsule biosynthesis protein) n=1 Tax=Sediminitomix flava TaxID=379075 RepID=A0A315Z4X0_SEDFL|nr:CapA family protein [Sediminitomix flava]PWJ38528.1 poly-gamma-glutamate synthesis protein (capsule biosynthesis protein) [Sediminitomix flava]